ncbi:uncharacterized protein [Spinacia oleracea]|uniref:Uncharacterized protein n=1 Tax=Spinacia oleracea TaxID=3562 RepID=A0ABM3R8T2_SPIOL|nr:uncharacterized protein LOC110801293 [Spinacia oleracea]
MNITVVIGTSLFLQEHHRRYINITLNWNSHAIKHVEELVNQYYDLLTFLWEWNIGIACNSVLTDGMDNLCVLDVGCRMCSTFVTGLNNNEYQITRGKANDFQASIHFYFYRQPTDTHFSAKMMKKELRSKLKKFLLIQESAFKQKSRIQWLKLGDSNSKFFFSAMKERNSRNSIDELFDSAGQKLSTNKEITEEIRSFYTALIGTAAPSIVGIDVEVVRRGNQLSPDAAESLIRPVTTAEIDKALKFIDVNKAPGLDGLHSFFF